MTSGITTTAAGGSVPPPTPQHGAAETSGSWRLIDRVGLAFAWILGLVFCAIALGIVIYLAVQGIRFLRPSLLWTNPKVSDTQSRSSGPS
jgi:hypothetical protein